MSFAENNRIIRFFKEAVAELRKVVWPTKKQAIRLTLIVIGVVIVTALFLGGFDLIFSRIIRFIILKSS